MTNVLILFGALCLLGTRLCFPNKDYISRDTTIQVNGIFVFLVLLSHFVGNLTSPFPNSEGYMGFRDFMNQLVVTTFLFYSGYGVMVSIQKKGMDYVNKLPVKMVELVINFSIAIALFALLGWIFDKDYSLAKMIAACVGWKSIGNSNWYLFDILLLYALSFSAYLVSKQSENRFLIVMFVLSIMAMIFLEGYQNGTRWYNTFLCYWVGLVYAAKKVKIEAFVMRSTQRAVGTLLIGILCFIILHYFRGNMLCYILHAIVFVLCVNGVSMFVSLNNPILLWLGKHIFSIYILQRIPMIIGKELGWHESHMILYFIGVLVLCFILAEVFDRFTKLVVKKLIYE